MVQVTVEARMPNHSRGLERLSVTGDSPAVTAVLEAVLANDGEGGRFGHPNEAKIQLDGLNYDWEKGLTKCSTFVRAYAPPEVRGRTVGTLTAYKFGERLLTALGIDVERTAWANAFAAWMDQRHRKGASAAMAATAMMSLFSGDLENAVASSEAAEKADRYWDAFAEEIRDAVRASGYDPDEGDGA